MPQSAPLPPADEEPPSSPFYQLTPTCLIVSPDTEYGEWEQMWQSLDQTSRSINWAIGDALLFGESHWPDQWSQVLDAQYVEPHKVALWVASRIPPAERREGFSWSSHRVTARLTTEQRAVIFDLAEEHGWTSKLIGEEAAKRYPDETRKRKKASTYPRNDPDPEEAEPEVPATERWPEPPPPISTVPEPEPVDRGVAVRRPDSRGNLARPDQWAIDAADAARPKPLPETPDALFRTPEQVREALAEELRGMLGRYREIVGRLDEAGFGWLITLDDPTANFAVALRRGNQIAVGNHEYVPLALAEAAIAALISDLGAG